MMRIRTIQLEQMTATEQLPDDVLIQRLRLAKRSDLDDLLRALKLKPDRFKQTSDSELIALISGELRSAAGNSIANVRRGKHEFPYKQVVIDVADKLHPGKIKWTPYKLDDAHTLEEIENYVCARLQERISKWVADLSPDQRHEVAARIEYEMRTKGYPEAAIQATLAGVLGGAVSGALLGGVVTSVLFGTAWTTLFGFSLLKLIFGSVVLGGPVALTLGVATLAISPSYSKTIPAVYRLAQIRRSVEERDKL